MIPTQVPWAVGTASPPHVCTGPQHREQEVSGDREEEDVGGGVIALGSLAEYRVVTVFRGSWVRRSFTRSSALECSAAYHTQLLSSL